MPLKKFGVKKPSPDDISVLEIIILVMGLQGKAQSAENSIACTMRSEKGLSPKNVTNLDFTKKWNSQ